MTMKKWGRLLLLWGLGGAALSFLPALLLMLTGVEGGFFGTVAILLSISVTPLLAVVASVGAILLLVAVVRRDPL